MSTIILHPSLI